MTLPGEDRLSLKGRIVAHLTGSFGTAAAMAGGFWAGMMAWCWGYYLLEMAPKGTPFRAIDQAAMPGLLVGVLFAIISGLLAGRLLWRLGVALARRLERQGCPSQAHGAS